MARETHSTSPQPDPAIVDRLVASHRSFLAFVERRVGDRAAAEDILQSAFVRGLEKLGDLQDAGRAEAWFYRVLRNAIVDHWRRGGSESSALGRLKDAQDHEAGWAELEREVCACVGELVETLKPEYAEVVRRVDLQGASVAEAAEGLGVTPNNLRVRLHRARRALGERLAETCGTCVDHGCYDCSCDPSRPGAQPC